MAVALSPAQTISAAGQQLVFNCPPTQLVNPVNAVIYNKSPYELMYLATLIPAWSIIPIPLAGQLGGSPNMILIPILAANVSTPSVATVYVQWLDASEEVPDELSFIADAVAAALIAVPSASEFFAGPGSGSEFIVNFTAAARLMTVGCEFSTGGTVANRIMSLRCFDAPNGGGNLIWTSGPNFTQVNGLTLFYYFWQTPNFVVYSGGPFVSPIPIDFIVNAGWSLKSFTQGLQATDNYQSIIVTTAAG